MVFFLIEVNVNQFCDNYGIITSDFLQLIRKLHWENYQIHLAFCNTPELYIQGKKPCFIIHGSTAKKT